MKKISGLFAAGLVASVMATAPAKAVTGTCDSSNGGGNKYIQLSSVAANDSNNVICQVGNPDYSGPVFEETFFGETFTLAFKSTGSNLVKEKGDDKVTFNTFLGGTWALNSVSSDVEKIIIGIKQGTTYAGFLVDSTSGTWATGNNATALGTNFSHVDIWYTAGTTVIPLPAAGFLLLGALGGLGFAARRRRRMTG